MKNNFLLFISIFTALLFPNINFGQAPNLGVASDFVLFTRVGAFNGDPATSMTGDIGTNAGLFTPPGMHPFGQVHVADAVSAQAAIDVSDAYMYLSTLTCGIVLNTPFGNGQTLTPNIYCIGSAAVLNANLILNAQGNPNAIFIFLIDGALSTNPSSNITLANGAKLCNVYWQVNGALNLGGNSSFLGTVLAEGAINLASGASLTGRALTTEGAISTSNNIVTVDPCDCSLTVTCPAPVGGLFPCIADIPVGTAADVAVITSCGTATVAITEISSGTGCAASPFILERTYTTTDTRGNMVACVVTYTAADNVAPILTCPTVISPIQCPAVRNFGLATAIDACDATVDITTVDNPTPGGNCLLGVGVTRTWTATDDCGNTATCSRTIAVADNTAPVLTCPTVVSPIQCPTVRNFGLATAIDACDATVDINFADNPTPGGSCILGVGVTRTWTATDDCGNTATCSRTIAVIDNNLPVIACPTVISPVSCPAVPDFGLATATDGCDANPAINFTDLTIPSGIPQQYSVIRTWTATDACGNSATCSRTIVVGGYALPSIVCPTNIVKNTDSNLCGAVVTYNAPVFSAGCGGSASLTRISGLPSGSVFPKGITMVNWKVTDALGNTAICGFTVTVNDNQPPAIICPPNIDKWTTTNQCNAVVFYAVKGLSDNCPGVTSSVMSGLPSGSAFPKGVTTIVLKATDGTGLMKTCSFTVKVSDGQPPTLLCPPNQAKSTDPNLCTAVTTYLPPTVTDNCALSPTVTIQGGLPSGSTFPRGITTVVWKATDGAGLTKTCSFRVTVNDNQAPALICPASMLRNTEADQCSAVATYQSPTFTDNCAGSSLIRWSGLASGSTFPTGVNVVVWKATDASGNFQTCSFTVTVNDLQLPVITCPANIVLPTDANVCCATVRYGNLPNGQPTAVDNCPGVLVTLLNGFASGSAFPPGVTAVVWEATDRSGNTATCSFQVTINDTQPPMIMCPANRTVNGIDVPCGYPSANLLAAAVMMENCPAGFTLTSNAPLLLVPGSTQITWTAVDASNNVSTCSYAVTVICTTTPGSGGGVQMKGGSVTFQGLDLKIAPNPAISQVTFLLEGVDDTGGELVILDALGRMVWKQMVEAEEQQLSLDVSTAHFPGGVYQVYLRTERSSVTKGLVVNKL